MGIHIESVLPKYESYLRDESRLTGHAEKIAFPESPADMAAAFQYAREENLCVTLQGGRTGIVGGASPRGGLIVCTEKMNRILGLRKEEGRFFLRVQAGVTLQQLEAYGRYPETPAEAAEAERAAVAALKRAGRHFFGPNPTEKSATLGGLFACDAGGINSLRYGRTARQVRALTWVTPSGEIWEVRRVQYLFDENGCSLPNGTRFSCRTDLPAAPHSLRLPREGMDLIDFLVASEGYYGAAAEMEVCLTPQPAEGWGVLYFFQKEEQVFRFSENLRDWRDTDSVGYLCGAEYYDSAVLNLVRERKQQITAFKALPDFPPNALAAVYVELCGGDPARLEEALYTQLELFAEAGGEEADTWAAGSFAELERYRELRHAVPEALNTEIDRLRQAFPELVKTTADYKAPPELAADYLRRYHGDIAGTGLRGFVFGHILENHFHVNLLPESEEQLGNGRALLKTWAEQVVRDGGILAAENGVGKLKADLIRAYIPEPIMAFLQDARKIFDPYHLMDSQL